MNSLYDLLAKPAPFRRDPTSFWDEPHVSEQLLKAHLDPDFEGASRKHEFIDLSVGWITGIAPPERYPDVLDIGCGPGLYAQRLHDRGYRVTGIDFSRRSIAYAKNMAATTGRRIEYRYGNYLEMEFRESFDLVILVYCDYGALSPEEGASLLGRIHRSLRPGGKLLLDVFAPRKYASFLERRVWEFHENGGFWRPDSHFTIQADGKYGDLVTLEQTTVVSQQETRAYHIWNRYFTPELLSNELQRAGFRTQTLFGDVSGKPVSDDSETLAVAAER